jgi:Putative transposase
VLKRVFRGKFIDGLEDAFAQKRLQFAGLIQHLARPTDFAAFLRNLHRHEWVVYIKPPFGGPEQVLRYLGRYTHRVAISNHRLLAFDGNNVTFRWRDYAHGNVQRTMTVSAEEFIRRFLMHVLPKSFVRIRHFGFMANYRRATSFELCRLLLGMAPVLSSPETASTSSTRLCPTCQAPLTVVQRFTSGSDCLAIRLEMLFGYLVAEAANGICHDVSPHPSVKVCFHLRRPSLSRSGPPRRTVQTSRLCPRRPHRRPILTLWVLRSVKTSTPIPPVSP